VAPKDSQEGPFAGPAPTVFGSDVSDPAYMAASQGGGYEPTLPTCYVALDDVDWRADRPINCPTAPACPEAGQGKLVYDCTFWHTTQAIIP